LWVVNVVRAAKRPRIPVGFRGLEVPVSVGQTGMGLRGTESCRAGFFGMTVRRVGVKEPVSTAPDMQPTPVPAWVTA